MAVPKKKTSKSRKGMRRSHHSLNKICLSIDSVSGDYRLSHHVNPENGMYRGMQIIKQKNNNIDESEA